MHEAFLVYHLALGGICVARRRSAIGGWLLFYLTELVLYVVVRSLAPGGGSHQMHAEDDETELDTAAEGA